MAEYDIILHSPMGPRRGRLAVEGGAAYIDLLGRESRLAAEISPQGLCRLTGQLDSVMGPIPFAAEAPAGSDAFDCIARTGKGDMRLTGLRRERSETHLERE